MAQSAGWPSSSALAHDEHVAARNGAGGGSSSTGSAAVSASSSAHTLSAVAADVGAQPSHRAHQQHYEQQVQQEQHQAPGTAARDLRDVLAPSYEPASPGGDGNLRVNDYAASQHQQPHGRPRGPVVASQPLPPTGLRTRVYGLAKDLRGPSPDSAHLPVIHGGANAQGGSAHGTSKDAPAPTQQSFSVEVQAPSFDMRGYPIYQGRGAAIRGILRMPGSESCDVVMRLWAYTSQGSPAAVWDGIALMPPDQGSERKVFEVTDRLSAERGTMKARPAAPGDEPSANFPASDELILSIPFDVRMPLGAATRFVNGEMQSLAVALPPSYEMSSEADSKEREAVRGIKDNYLKSSSATVRTKMTMSNTTVANSLREAIERGFGEVYRIGCFYSMSFTLQRKAPEKEKKSRFGKSKKTDNAPKGVLDTITVPFIFLGEPSPIPPAPPMLPELHPDILFRANQRLSDGWTLAQTSAKWSGQLLTSLKRGVELELHTPGVPDAPPCIHSPGAFPILLIIRPADPNLLPAARAQPDSPGMSTSASWSSNFGSPGQSTTHSPKRSAASIRGASSPMAAHEHLPGGAHDVETGSTYTHNAEGDDDGPGGIVARMRSSLHLSRMSTAIGGGHAGSASTVTVATNQSGGTGDSGGSGGTQRSIAHKRSRPSLASTFGRRRPKTAPPSSHGSTSPPGSVAGTVVPERGDGLDLTRLVRISLLQTTYCTSTGPSDMPRVRRRVISLAELEELDLASIVGPPTSPSLGGQESTSSAASRAMLEHAQSSGVRLLRGMVRVGRDLTPGFRCQGIEVKYALKVDLLPFSPRQARRRPASGGGANRGGPSISEALRSINENSRSSSHRTPGYAESSAGFSTSGSGNFSVAGDPPRTPPMPSPSYRGSSMTTGGSPGAPSHRGGSPSTALGSPVLGSDARSFAGGAGPMSVVGGTVYDEDGSVAGKIDKTVGSLWVDVRLLRSSMG